MVVGFSQRSLRGVLTYGTLMLFAAYSLYSGTVSAGVDNAAHVGGLLGGLILGLLLARPREPAVQAGARLRWVPALGVYLLCVAGALAYLSTTPQAFNAINANAVPALAIWCSPSARTERVNQHPEARWWVLSQSTPRRIGSRVAGTLACRIT